MDATQIISLVILTVLAALLVSGTLFDVICQIKYNLKHDELGKDKSPDAIGTGRLFFESFSMYSNACRLLDTSEKSGNLSALNGLRVFSILFVIVGHTFNIDSPLIGNRNQVQELPLTFLFQGMMNLSLTVDTFFFISGLLVVYVNLKKLSKTSEINWIQFYLHRYWRLTPPVAILIVFLLLWPMMGSGPNWATETALAAFCRNNWWSYLLYINNFYGVEEPCLRHGWYLAVDMQFYLVSPLIIYPMWRWPMLGLLINGIFLIASIVTAAALSFSFNLIPQSLAFADQRLKDYSMTMVYNKPYCRMGPYCLGMALGYMLTTKHRFQLTPVVQAVFWCASFALSTTAMFGIYSWNSGHQHSSSLIAIYMSSYRTAWTLGIAWLTYACLYGHAGIVNRILSWKPFVVLARLTYVAYLIHYFILNTFSGLMGDRLVFSRFIWVVIIFGVITTTFILSFLASLCMEMPFQCLENLFWAKHKSSESIALRARTSHDQESGPKEEQGILNKAYSQTN